MLFKLPWPARSLRIAKTYLAHTKSGLLFSRAGPAGLNEPAGPAEPARLGWSGRPGRLGRPR